MDFKDAPLAASIATTFLILMTLAHITMAGPKPIEILRMPRFMFAGSDLGFQVRVRGAVDEDRELWIILCNLEDEIPCTTEHNERVSMVSIEGSACPKLFSPRPWTHMPPGQYAVVAALGAFGKIRVSDALSVNVQGM